MATLSINKAAEARTWVLSADRHAVASLRINRLASFDGELQTIHGTWPIVRVGRRWSEVTVGEPVDPLVMLEREAATIRGAGEFIPTEVGSTGTPSSSRASSQ